VALAKKIILFILSIIFTILLLAATTSFAADEFSGDVMDVCIRGLQEHQRERQQTDVEYFTKNSFNIG
tara:strand:+ start:796 stop:999 length:204 start_codon:yes stop_codon:yes gene_type:complete